MKSIKINKNAIIVIKSLVFTVIATLLLTIMLRSMKYIGLNMINDGLIVNILLDVTILMVQVLVLRMYSKGNVLTSIGIINENNSIKYIFTGIGVGLIGAILMYSVIFLGEIGFYEESGFKIYGIKTIAVFILSTFIRAFFAGVCEEVFFRGVLLSYLAKYKGKTFGLLVSTIIFTLLHCTRYQSFIQLSLVFISGLTLGYIYIVTKSLYMSVGLHFATDFFLNLIQTKGQVGVLIFNINPKFTSDDLNQICFMLMSAMYLILLIILILRRRCKKKCFINNIG